DIVNAVKLFKLSNRDIQKGHSVTDLNSRLWTNTTHGRTKTSVEHDHSELVQKHNSVTVGKRIVRNDLLRCWGCDLGPVDFVALGFVIEVSAEKSEEVVHFRLKALLLLRIFDSVC